MSNLIAGLTSTTVSATTVLLLAGLGELISERAGILNLGVEGIMLIGALSGFVTASATGSYWLGFGVAIIAGGIFSLIHAVLCISLNADQAVSGIMLTLLGTGLSTYFGSSYSGASIDGFPDIAIPILVEIPILGSALFNNAATDYIAFLVFPAVWLLLYRTNIGLEIISVGEDPETANTMGVNVVRMRYLSVIICGAFAGAAGAHLSLAFTQIWSGGMTAGQGWIAVALVIFARWEPARLFAGAILFGGLNAFQLFAQGFNFSVGAAAPLAEIINPVLGFVFNPTIMSTYPYIATLLVLTITVIRAENRELAQPSALVQTYNQQGE
jgi:simple sugar transport system permease protein